MIRKRLLANFCCASVVVFSTLSADAQILPRIGKPVALLQETKSKFARKALNFADKLQNQDIDAYTPRKGDAVPKKIKLHFFSGNEFEGADHVEDNGIAKVNGELLYTDSKRKILRIMNRDEFRYWQSVLAQQPEDANLFDKFINLF